MSLDERVRATAKNIEGKIQEAVGDLTGDSRQQIVGQAKRVEAATRQAKEDVKDTLKRNLDRI